MSMHLRISEGDYLIPIPVDVIADMANAVTGILDIIPCHCQLNMALLKTLVPPLSVNESIEVNPDIVLSWLYEDKPQGRKASQIRAKSLAHLIPEVIVYKATVRSTPNKYREHVAAALESMNHVIGRQICNP